MVYDSAWLYLVKKMDDLIRLPLSDVMLLTRNTACDPSSETRQKKEEDDVKRQKGGREHEKVEIVNEIDSIHKAHQIEMKDSKHTVTMTEHNFNSYGD